MANYTLTPEVHYIFNEFDSQGLLLGTPRIENEPNTVYKQRLLDVFVNRASSTYQGIINGVTRELGLSIVDTLSVDITITGANTLPAIIFEETKCTLYSDYSTLTVLETFDRFDLDSPYWTLSGLAAGINSVTGFVATIDPDVSVNQRAMTIFNQSSIKQVTNESLLGKGQRIKLEYSNLIEGTVSVVSPSLANIVTTEGAVQESGDYFVDHENGLIVAGSIPANGSFVRYQAMETEMTFKSSPIILHSLQSADFQTKMFEQETDGDGNTVNGHPTALGADLINELLSVYPTAYGK
jgi:hypothetical protein